MFTLAILAIQFVCTLIALGFKLIMLISSFLIKRLSRDCYIPEYEYIPQLQSPMDNDIIKDVKVPGYYVYGRKPGEKEFKVIARYDEEKYARARLYVERSRHKDMMFMSGRVD